MFRKKRLRSGLGAALLAALALLLAAGGLFAVRRVLAAPNRGGGPAPEEDPAPERHVAFLAGCGWTVSPEPVSVSSVHIPETFGAVYRRYNLLQQAQGFDLTPYRGRTVRKYVYELLNYPGEAGAGTVRANVLEADGAVIGGDISSVRLDGFMHGFRGETGGMDGYDPTG